MSRESVEEAWRGGGDSLGTAQWVAAGEAGTAAGGGRGGSIHFGESGGPSLGEKGPWGRQG